MVAAELPAPLCYSVCDADDLRSLSIALGIIASFSVRKDRGAPAVGSLYAAICGMYPDYPLFGFQATTKIKLFLINLFIFEAKVSVLIDISLENSPCF